jgi:glycosyltransferase involved in cell wall biosynthesis
VYDAIDAFAFPAHAEALGSALLLAMAHGLPCVALARGGIPDSVTDGVNGVLIQKPRVEEWAAALEHVLTDSTEAQRLGAEARATIIQRFSADRMVDATLELYAQAHKK